MDIAVETYVLRHIYQDLIKNTARRRMGLPRTFSSGMVTSSWLSPSKAIIQEIPTGLLEAFAQHMLNLWLLVIELSYSQRT